MKKAHRTETFRTGAYDIQVIGVPRPGLRDLYHALLRVPWWATLVIIVGGYLLLNALFAALYVGTGGVANARPGSFVDAFFFSVQTMGTIGYGVMYPATTAANVLVVAESVTSLVLTALAAGLVFVRFSQTRARLIFSLKAAIGPMDGVPTLMMRIGNERRGSIVGTQFYLTFMRTDKTAEGMTIYRLEELTLVRARAPALSRSWNVLHRVEKGSPLYGYDAEKLAAVEGELQLEVFGTDDTSLQQVHARYTWFAGSVEWGSRLADVVSETPDGNMILDLRNFHDVVPVGGTPDLPLRRSSEPSKFRLHPKDSAAGPPRVQQSPRDARRLLCALLRCERERLPAAEPRGNLGKQWIDWKAVHRPAPYAHGRRAGKALVREMAGVAVIRLEP